MNICASYLTLAGSSYGKPARYSPLERAQAAHAAGIPAIGVSMHEDIDESVLRYVTVPEAEWIELSFPLLAEERRKLAVLRDLGVTRVNAGVTLPRVSIATAAVNLARLAEVTAPLGITVAVEPVAFGSHKTIDDIRMVLKASGVSPEHAGLLYDWWQTSYDPENLFAFGHDGTLLPLAEVQLCGFRDDDPDTEDPAVTSQDRPLLADCALSSVRWLRNELRKISPDVPLSYEMPRADWRELPLIDVAELAAKDMSLLS